MAISTTERPHPLVRAVAAAARELALAAEVPLWSLSAGELQELTVELSALSSAVSAVEATVLAQADRSDVVAAAGATSTATWLAQATRSTRAAAHGRVRLANALDERPATASALGRVDYWSSKPASSSTPSKQSNRSPPTSQNPGD